MYELTRHYVYMYMCMCRNCISGYTFDMLYKAF